MKKWSVYIHTTPSNKYYVGITSQDVKYRWRNGKGYKMCIALNNAINKYGWDNIQHEIIASNLTESEAKNFEILLIKKLKSNTKKGGYNLTGGGDGALGRYHTVATKNKISVAHMGISINCGITNGMYGKLPTTTRKVLCMTTSVKYESLKQASIDNNIANGALSRALKENRKCKGLEWRFI